MKIINALITIAAVGCNQPQQPAKPAPAEEPQPPVEETAMPSVDQPNDAADKGPTLSLFVMSWAVHADEMPKVMRDKLDSTPAVMTLAEVRALDPETKSQVLAVIEKAIAHFRKEAEPYRARGNPSQHTADELGEFLKAAQE